MAVADSVDSEVLAALAETVEKAAMVAWGWAVMVVLAALAELPLLLVAPAGLVVEAALGRNRRECRRRRDGPFWRRGGNRGDGRPRVRWFWQRWRHWRKWRAWRGWRFWLCRQWRGRNSLRIRQRYFWRFHEESRECY